MQNKVRTTIEPSTNDVAVKAFLDNMLKVASTLDPKRAASAQSLEKELRQRLGKPDHDLSVDADGDLNVGPYFTVRRIKGRGPQKAKPPRPAQRSTRDASAIGLNQLIEALAVINGMVNQCGDQGLFIDEEGFLRQRKAQDGRLSLRGL